MYQLKIPAPGSIRPTSIAFLARCSRPKSTEWEWGFPSATRLSKATRDVFGSPRLLPEARTSNLNYPQKKSKAAKSHKRYGLNSDLGHVCLCFETTMPIEPLAHNGARCRLLRFARYSIAVLR